MHDDFLSGMTVTCFGDSTTWGDDGTGAGGPSISWTSHLSRLTGASLVLNLGVKGSRVGRKADRDDSFVERLGTLPAHSDVTLVFGGVNDFCREVPLGERGTTDEWTFRGALATVLRAILERDPETKLVLMTPCKTAGVEAKGLPDSFSTNGLGLVEEDYARAAREVADALSVPVIDLYASSGISPFVAEHRERYMPDGLHYSPAGYERLARRIAAGLSAIVR